MNTKIPTLILIKNLIENNNFSQVYKLKGEFYWTQKKIYNHICYYNFGAALLEIENELFLSLKDEDFEVTENLEEDINDNDDDYDDFDDRDSGEDSIDWSHYDDNLDMDQQSDEFWNQF